MNDAASTRHYRFSLHFVLALAGFAGCIPNLPEVEAPCERWEAPGTYRFAVDRPGSGSRYSEVYVPDSEGPRPLVVLLHGGGTSGATIAENVEFEKGADAFGFVLVVPNGQGYPLRTWNAGGPIDTGVDDVGFLEALVEQLAPRVCGEGVLATGFSNGGMMAHRWACEGDVVDAVAPVAGPLLLNGCPGDPLPVRHYHGLQDAVVPPGGGTGESPITVVYPSVEESMVHWQERNACTDAEPVVAATGDTTCTRYDCDAATEVCLVEGWGHAWPGGRNAESTDANATRAIWNWFQEVRPAPDPTETSPPTTSSE